MDDGLTRAQVEIVRQLTADVERLDIALQASESLKRGYLDENERLRKMLSRWLDFADPPLNETMIVSDTRVALGQHRRTICERRQEQTSAQLFGAMVSRK